MKYYINIKTNKVYPEYNYKEFYLNSKEDFKEISLEEYNNIILSQIINDKVKNLMDLKKVLYHTISIE